MTRDLVETNKNLYDLMQNVLIFQDMTIEIVDAMKEAGQLQRGLNVCSVDSASRREPPLVTAARTGQTEALSMLLKCKGIEVEKR